jgi:hypothetical protein
MNKSNCDGRDVHLSLPVFKLSREYLEPSDPTLIQFVGMTVW